MASFCTLAAREGVSFDRLLGKYLKETTGNRRSRQDVKAATADGIVTLDEFQRLGGSESLYKVIAGVTSYYNSNTGRRIPKASFTITELKESGSESLSCR